MDIKSGEGLSFNQVSSFKFEDIKNCNVKED